jgi:hypothetical protein
VEKLAGKQVDQKQRPFAISNIPPLLFIYLETTQYNQELAECLTLSNPIFSANRILPSSYLFWVVKMLVDCL